MTDHSRSQRYHQYLSPMFYDYTGRKGASKGGAAKGGRLKTSLPRKPLTEDLPIEILTKKEQKCPEFSCERIWKPPTRSKKILDPCPPATCPPNYRIVYESNEVSKSSSCPKYECKPPPPQDSVCNVTGRTFGTFDGTVFQYDICNHVLARDLNNDDWEIILSKKCDETKLDLRSTPKDEKSTKCHKELTINHADETVKLFQDMSVEYNGYR